MGIIVDLIIVAFILISVFLGYKKGLVELGMKLFAFIIAIVLTFILYRPIGNLVVNTTQVDETIQNKITAKVEEIIDTGDTEEPANQLIESAKNGMLPQASRTMAINIVYGGVMIILFIALRIGLMFIKILANAIAKLPILKQFNKAGGVIYGFVRGVIVTYVALTIISFVGTINPENAVQKSIDESALAKTMSNYNLLNVFFNDIV